MDLIKTIRPWARANSSALLCLAQLAQAQDDEAQPPERGW
jgi:hypothetical protein